jgi:hypothetical protein
MMDMTKQEREELTPLCMSAAAFRSSKGCARSATAQLRLRVGAATETVLSEGDRTKLARLRGVEKKAKAALWRMSGRGGLAGKMPAPRRIGRQDACPTVSISRR